MTDEELAEYKRANGIKDVDVKKNEKIKTVYNNYANWIMIGLMMLVQLGISLLASVDGNIISAFPHTKLEWIIWVALRVITAVVSFMIFNFFVKEGEKRGKLSENYKNAHERWLALFNGKLSREAKTQSPTAFLAKTRGFKALGLIVSAVLTGVAIGSATIILDWTGLIGTIVSLIMMIVWGYLKMLEVEDYFTNGYPEYVIVLEHKLAIEAQNKPTEEPQNSKPLVEEQNDNNRQQNLS